MHVLVGKSVVINVQTALTRVLSSNSTAVEAMATSPTQVVVEGKAAGNSSLILWDTSGQSQVLDVAVDLDIAGLQEGTIAGKRKAFCNPSCNPAILTSCNATIPISSRSRDVG